jgi:hypothetical protein
MWPTTCRSQLSFSFAEKHKVYCRSLCVFLVKVKQTACHLQKIIYVVMDLTAEAERRGDVNYGVNYVLMDLTTEADRRGDVNYDL